MRYRRGTAAVLAMIFMVILSMLAVAFTTTTNTTIQVTRNERSVHLAQAAAESGLEYTKNVLSQQLSSPVPANNTAVAQIISNLSGYCSTMPLRDDSGNGIDLTSSSYVRVGGNTFKVQFSRNPITSHGYYLHVVVTGLDGSGYDSATSISRVVQADFYGTVDYPMFDEGVYCQGGITLAGSATVVSMKDAQGHSLYTYTYTDPATGRTVTVDGAGLRSALPITVSTTITQKGNSIPDGGFWVTGAPTQVQGLKQVNYTTDPTSPNYCVHAYTTMPHMPTFDPTAFSDLATTVYSPNVANTYTNVRIPANTNPSLSGTFRGILYIESPNNVSFSSPTLNCAVVVADKDNLGNQLSPGTSTLNFTGQISGGRIPDDLLAIRDAVGGYGVLAPTANLNIQGNGAQTLYGSIICNTLDWEGGSTRQIIDGSIIILSTDVGAVKIGGNANIQLMKDANFVKPTNGLYDSTYAVSGFRMAPNSYVEGQ